MKGTGPRLGPTLFVLFSGLAPAAAQAHPLVDRGVAAYEDAEFSAALEHFVEAEQTDELVVSDVEQLLLHRALCHYALGDQDAFRRELEKLARLAPNFALGASIPPRVRDAFAEQVEGTPALELSVEAIRTSDGVRVVARVTGDPGGLVRKIRVRATPASGRPIQREGPTVNVPAAAGETVRYRAETLGPGGALIRHQEGLSRPPTPTSNRTLPLGPHAAGKGGAEANNPLWPWLVTGAGVLTVGAVVTAVLVATATTETQFGAPEVR